MPMTEDLERLAELHRNGGLSDAEFARAKDRVLAGAQEGNAKAWMQDVKGLRRSATDRWLGGVCGGIAVTLGLPSWAVRLIFVALLVCGGTGFVAYMLFWILVPLDNGVIDIDPNPGAGGGGSRPAV